LLGQEIDGHLEDWSPCSNPFDLDFVVGIVTGDRKERFPDGTLMTTSMLTTPRNGLEAGAIIETQNSRYRLGRRASEVTSDAFLYAAGLNSWVIGPDDEPVRQMSVVAKSEDGPKEMTLLCPRHRETPDVTS
jgi:hypothetical protein